jgi:hypothetical protein
MGLTTPIIVVCGQPVGFKEPTGSLICGRACWGSRPTLSLNGPKYVEQRRNDNDYKLKHNEYYKNYREMKKKN